MEAGKSKATAKDILRDVIREFGFISDALDSEAVYVLRSGRILNTKGSNARASHDNIAGYISKKFGIDDLDEYNGSRFMRKNCNAMRITPWFNGVFLPESDMTEEQCKTLIAYINKARITKGKPLIISTMDGRQQAEFKDKRVMAEDIVGMCRQYYADGKLLTEAKNLAESTNLLKYMHAAPKKGACFITPKGLFVYGTGLDHSRLLAAIGYPGDDDAVVKAKK